MQNVIRCKLL